MKVVSLMKDEDRHLEEYRKYKSELDAKLGTESDKQTHTWLEMRLKAVERRISQVEHDADK